MGDVTICPICGYKLSGVRCPKCNAVYPKSLKEQFTFYDEFYDDKFLIISYLRRPRVYQTIANKILNISKSKGDRIFIDIGASFGISIILFQQYGKAIGVELDIPQLREWHKFLGIESAMRYINKDDNIKSFYAKLAEELSGEIDSIFIIDTLRYIPLPELIDILSICLKEMGTIVIKEINPDNRNIFVKRLSGEHSDVIMYSPKTINYIAQKNKLTISWYIVHSAVDNFAIKIPYNILRILRPATYIAVLEKEGKNDNYNTSA